MFEIVDEASPVVILVPDWVLPTDPKIGLWGVFGADRKGGLPPLHYFKGLLLVDLAQPSEDREDAFRLVQFLQSHHQRVVHRRTGHLDHPARGHQRQRCKQEQAGADSAVNHLD